MDLKIKDVAELLNVSQSTVRKWLDEGQIPAYKIQGQDRFSKLEIESWVMNYRQEKKPRNLPFEATSEKKSFDHHTAATAGSQKFSLFRALHKGETLHAVPGKTKEEIIRNATKQLAKTHGFDSDLWAELLIDRENLQPTALNNGLAVPHTRECILNPHHDFIAVVFPKEPIPYGALDGEPVHTLLFLSAGNDKRHLHLLAKLAHLSYQNKEFNSLLQKQPEKEALLEFVKAWESKIPSPDED